MRAWAGTTGALVLLAGLAGCGPSSAELMAADQARCSGFGFAPGTDAYATCMMNLTQQRTAEEAAYRRASEQNQLIQQKLDQDRQNREWDARREETQRQSQEDLQRYQRDRCSTMVKPLDC